MYGELTTYERRESIRLLLVRKRHTKIKNLVDMFDVSKQTILKDIAFLSSRLPITTKTGKCGGIFLNEEVEAPREYLSKDEENLLLYISKSLNKRERIMISNIINKFSIEEDN